MRPNPPRFPVGRPPRPRVLVTALVAVVAAAVVHRATETAAALGETTTVAVVDVDVAAGDVIGNGDVVLVARPSAHLPDGALTEDPVGRTARVGLVPGEIVVDDRLAGAGRHGPRALVPEGWRAVAVPVVDVPLPVEIGDVVDVIASYDPAVVDRTPTLVVAADALVVDVADEAVTVAVPRVRATEVAFALANGLVTLALVG